MLKNTGDTGIAFEQVEIGSRAGGTVDSFSGGMGTEPFARRLEPGGELRIAPKPGLGLPLSALRRTWTGCSPMGSSSTTP